VIDTRGLEVAVKQWNEPHRVGPEAVETVELELTPCLDRLIEPTERRAEKKLLRGLGGFSAGHGRKIVAGLKQCDSFWVELAIEGSSLPETRTFENQDRSCKGR